MAALTPEQSQAIQDRIANLYNQITGIYPRPGKFATAVADACTEAGISLADGTQLFAWYLDERRISSIAEVAEPEPDDFSARVIEIFIAIQ